MKASTKQKITKGALGVAAAIVTVLLPQTPLGQQLKDKVQKMS